MRILFVDTMAPKPYTLATLGTEPLGGTEATVCRVATRLTKLGHEVHVAQHTREVRQVVRDLHRP